MKERLQNFELQGPAGQLEALLHYDEETPPKGIAVVCHPHPLYGGNMHNKVAHRLDRALFNTGRAVLRFNYRGVGASAGRYGEGWGENDDLRAAISAMIERFPNLPLILAGFSFGAGRVLQVGWSDDHVERLILTGLGAGAIEELRDTAADRRIAAPKPILFIHASEDDVAPIDAAKKFHDRLSGPVSMVVIHGADHFFPEHLDEVERAVRDWLAADPPLKP